MDLRFPIGYLFSLLGLILVVWGVIGGKETLAKDGLNINLTWGIVMLVFGAVMWFFAKRGAKKG